MQNEVCAIRLFRRERPNLDELIITRKELAEGYLSIFIFIEDGDDSFDERILIELRDIENLIGVKVTRVIFINLFKAGVEFLYFFLAELGWKFCVTHLK